VMDADILLTKLFLPSAPQGFIRRSRLLDELNTGLKAGKPLTLVSAPAGYGKSSLLAEWITDFKGQAAWLSLDDRDNKAQRFWTYVTEAILTISPTLGQAIKQTLSPALESSGSFDSRPFLTALVNKAAALDSRLLLVLDDYHVISEQDIHEGLLFLLEHAPPTLGIVIATRTDPPLPLSRMRVRGKLTEVRAADLRFNTSETSGFLNDQMNLGLDAADVQALEARTEGWIAGLQLAALSMQDRADPHTFIQDFKGSQHFVMEYLVDEVLHRQPEALQRFMLATSILQRMCAPLCDAVTSSTGSADALADLQLRNLFIISLDGEHYWMRYHHLFAEFLKGRLKRLHSSQVPELHRLAAQWFQANNWPEEALQHAFAIPDYPYVSRLVVDNWRRVYHTGRLDTAVKWLESLPGDLLRQSPPLGVAYCWTLFIRGNHERIASYLDDIKKAFDRMVAAGDLPTEHPEYNIILHQISLLHTVVMRHHGHSAEAIKTILDLLPTIMELREILGERYIHMGFTAYYSQLGYSYTSAKDYDRAEEALSRVSAHARECGNYFSLAHATMEWSKICLMRGKTALAEKICRRELSLTETPELATYPAFCLIQLGLADVLRVQSALDEAERLLDQGLRTAASTGHQYYLAQGYLIAARLHNEQAKADPVKTDLVQADLRKAEQIAAALQNRFLDDDLARTTEALKKKSPPVQQLTDPLSERELEVLRLICAGKSNQEIADELFLALDTVKRHTNNLYGKLDVGRRTQAVMEARRLGLV
jgi:LuxR family transcriptional regulator, maltose regulon positive regulatory protein